MLKIIGKIKDADIYMIASDKVELGAQLEQKTAGRVLRDGTLFEPQPSRVIGLKALAGMGGSFDGL